MGEVKGIGERPAKVDLVENGDKAVSRKVLEELKNGSHEAFEFVFLHYINPIRRFLTKLLGSESEGNEIAQAVFLRLWEVHGSIDPDRNIKSYIFTIAKNRSLDYLKASRRLEIVPDCIEMESDVSTDDKLILKDTGQIIEQVVSQMPRVRQDVFRMHLNGFSYEEVSEKMNITVESAQQHVSRARKSLKEVLCVNENRVNLK